MELLVSSTLLGLVVGAQAVERIRLDRNLARIPYRIHVNGSRGKSSVVRLIAAALRGDGMRVVAKTTGTSPKIIHVNGSETPLYRLGKANIREQFHVVELAVQQEPDALVIECMALQPILQAISERKMVRATIGVITNCREDHLDVMGPEPIDVAKALCGTIPKGMPLVTAETRFLDVVKEAAKEMNSALHSITPDDIEGITDEEMTQFSYYEHRENVAVALRVAKLCGVKREDAIRGMLKVQPDDGALRVFHVPFFGRDIAFVHGFAANDTESSEQIWKLSNDCFGEYPQRLVVLNVRADRPDRSQRLGAAIPNWRPHVDHVILTGSGIPIAARGLMRAGFPPGAVTFAEDRSAREVFEEILNVVDEKALVVGIGNVAEPGLALVTLFRNRGTAFPMSRFYPGTQTDD